MDVTRQKVLENVLVNLEKDLGVPKERIKLTDSLHMKYGLAEEDLDDTVIKILNDLGIWCLPAPEDTAKMSPVNTVGDLVDFVVEIRRGSSEGH